MNGKKAILSISNLNIFATFLPIIFFTIDPDILKVNRLVLTLGALTIQLITIYINIYKYNKYIRVRDKNFIVTIIYLFVTILIIDLINENYFDTVKTTILIFLSIILLILLIYTDSNIENTFIKISKLLYIYVIFLIIYSIILKITAGNPVYMGQKEDGTLIYKQILNILGIKFSQIVMGNSIEGYSYASILSNPNTFSYLILFGVIAYTSRYTLRKSYTLKKTNINKYIKNKIINLLNLLIFAYGMVISGSRLAIMLFLIYICAYICFFDVDSKIYKTKFVLISIILLGIGLIMCIYISYNYSQILDNVYLNGRDKIWSKAISYITLNPFKAKGMGSSNIVLRNMFGINLSIHNTYLMMMIEYGLILTLLIIFVIIRTVIKSINNIVTTKYIEKRLFLLGLTMNVTVILTMGLSEVTFLSYSVYNYIFIYSIIFIRLIIKNKIFISYNQKT